MIFEESFLTVALRVVFKYCVHRWSQEFHILILLSLDLLSALPYRLSRNCCFASPCIMLNCDLSAENQGSVFLVWMGLGLSAAL